MSDYEAARMANIEANRALLSSLGIQPPSENKPIKLEPRVSKPRVKRKSSPTSSSFHLEPSRKSSRLSGIAPPSYTSDGSIYPIEPPEPFSSSSRSKGPTITHLRQLPRAPDPSLAIPEDYVPSYVAPPPTRGAGGVWRFEEGLEGFSPNMAPWEVWRAGSFGGTYWRPFYSSVKREQIPPNYTDFPDEWYTNPDIDADLYLTSTTYRPEINKYGVKASQSIEEWEKAGWIRAQDPRGWLEWYCHFFLGRRSPDDNRQIQRWAGCAGPRGRFKTGLVKKIVQAGGADKLNDRDVAPILRQTLLHWAVELSRESFEEYIS